MSKQPGLNGMRIRKIMEHCAQHIEDPLVLNELEQMLGDLKMAIENEMGAAMPMEDGAWRADDASESDKFADARKYLKAWGMNEDQIGEVIKLSEPGPSHGGMGGKTPRPAGMDDASYLALNARQRKATAVVNAERACEEMFGNSLSRIHVG